MANKPAYSGRLRAKPDWRNQASATIMADLISGTSLSGHVLIVDEYEEIVAQALSQSDITLTCWYLRALDGKPGSAWMPEDHFDTIILRLPKGKEAFDMLLHATVSRLKPHGQLFVFGANDEGIRSTETPMRACLENVRTLATRKHCRVLTGVRPVEAQCLRGHLTDWKHTFQIDLPGQSIDMVSYPGIFSHGRLDQGTRMLIDALPSLKGSETILDFGCGYGAISAALHLQYSNLTIHMLDVYALAVQAAKENVPCGETFLGDGWDTEGLSQYHLIVSNPPIHSGKGEDYRILIQLIHQAPSRLKRKGCLMIVVQRSVPANRILADVFDTVELVSESGQFRVWNARMDR